jgi:hypothetical protein
MGTTLLLTHSIYSQTLTREDIRKQIEMKRAELTILEDQFLAPDKADRQTYEELLAKPNTGLIRLLPREKFGDFEKSPKTLTIRGGGAYYSFAKLTHEYGYGSDIELSREVLSVGFAGADYGMLVKIGNVPLDEVTVEHPVVEYLASYKAAASEPEARIEQRRFGEGSEIEGTVYKERAPLEVGASYVLRSINFDISDVLVTFQVVRRDDDGSAVLVWRLLKKYDTPSLRKPRVTESIVK